MPTKIAIELPKAQKGTIGPKVEAYIALTFPLSNFNLQC